MINLKQISRQFTKENYINYLLIGVFFCLVAVGCTLVNFLVDGLGIILLIFLAIPMFFAINMETLMLESDPQVKLGDFLKISFSYYKPPFFGSFKLIKCFLKALLVEVIATSVFGFAMYFVYSSIYGSSFVDVYNQVFEAISAGEEFETFEQLLTLNDGIFNQYLYLYSGLASLFGIFVFLFGISYNSIGAYFRCVLNPQEISLNKRAVDIAMKNNKNEYKKDFWSLNWPLFVILAVSLALGFLVSFLWNKNYEFMSFIGLAIFFILFIFYVPYYLGNMKSLFAKYRNYLPVAVRLAIQNIVNRLNSLHALNEDEQKQIDETLQRLNDSMKEQEEETKKDPHEGS